MTENTEKPLILLKFGNGGNDLFLLVFKYKDSCGTRAASILVTYEMMTDISAGREQHHDFSCVGDGCWRRNILMPIFKVKYFFTSIPQLFEAVVMLVKTEITFGISAISCAF